MAIGKLIGGALLALLCTSGHAAKVTIGDYDCGQWFSEAKRTHAKTWLVGFLTGLNLATPDKTDPLGIRRRPDPESDTLARLNSGEQVILWMDNYCKANPLERLSTGGMVLFVELRTRTN